MCRRYTPPRLKPTSGCRVEGRRATAICGKERQGIPPMDQHHFPAWTRSVRGVPSRRNVLRSLAGAGLGLGALRLSDAVAAKDKKKRKKRKKQTCRPNCVERTCGNDGCGGSCGACGGGEICRSGTCCVPESRGATCAGRCGTRTNNCGQPVECATCAGGQVCLSNGSCAIACTNNNDCDACSGGACTSPNVEGEQNCSRGLVIPITTCRGTVDCPPGSHCEDMGGGGVCVELCL